MKKYYFTFPMDPMESQYYRSYHVEEAESYFAAREKMIEKFGTDWAFQYDDDEWVVSRENYDKIRYFLVVCGYAGIPEYHDGMTQADMFRLKEI